MNKKIPQSVSSILLACTLLTSIALWGANAPPASAGFSIVPSDPSERQFSLEIAPGKEKQSSAVIENLSDEPITLHLYGADGTQSNQGTFALTTLSTEQKHLGKWVVFAEPVIKLEPRQQKEVGFTVKVPANATPGIYGGGIAAESGGADQSGSKASTASSPAQSGAISISSRIVIKIFVSVPGKKANQYEWTGFSYTNSSGENGNSETIPSASANGNPQPPPVAKPGTFKLHYKNTGNTVIIADQKIQVTGFPMQSFEMELPPATLLQGSDIEIPTKWKDEPFFGFYTAKATTTFSEYDIITNSKKPGVTETKEISVYIPLKTETFAGKIVLGLLTLLTLLIVFLAISMIKGYLLKKRSRPYIVGQDETIASIAAKCKISWKRLADLNKLKAPYSIKAGQKILAPVKPMKPLTAINPVKPENKNAKTK